MGVRSRRNETRLLQPLGQLKSSELINDHVWSLTHLRNWAPVSRCLALVDLGPSSSTWQPVLLSRKIKCKVGPLLLVVAVSVVLGLPMILHGPLIDGHDTHEHLNYTKYFSEQFWQGELYPRWLIDMNHGLGSPSYFVYPPLPAYVCTLLEPLAKVFRFNAFNSAAWLPLLASGIAALLWLQTFVSRTVAAICAALYMLMPYHLTVDFYRRCAIPECWAFVWMPLILYFLPGVIAGKHRDSVGLAISFALMIFSHLISVAIFFPIPICIAALLSPIGQKLRSVIRVVLDMALGTGISSVYLLPALANAKYIRASRIVYFEVYKWSNNLVSFGPALFAHSGHENFVQTISWEVVSLVALVVICGTAALKWGSLDSKALAIFWISTCGFSVFMMSKFSSPLWHHVHGLHEAIQFPWRFCGLLCLGSLALIAVFLSSTVCKVRPHGIIFTGLLILVVATWLFAYGNVWQRYKRDVWHDVRDEDHLINDHDGWLPAWIPEGTVQGASLIASFGPKVRFKEGTGSTQLLSWTPRHIEFETSSPTGGWVMVNQFYYPTWKAELIDRAKPATVRTVMPEGLLEVQVPPGVQSIAVDIPTSITESMGRWLTALSLVFCLVRGFSKGESKDTSGHERRCTHDAGATKEIE